MEILRFMDMFLITKIPVYMCSIRVQKLLSAHVLDLLLINIKVHPISCLCANKFEYTMDDEVTKLILKHKTTHCQCIQNVSRNKDNSLV